MARSIKNLVGHRFLFKNCLPHTYFLYIFSQMHTHKMYRSCYFEIYFLIIIFDILKISQRIDSVDSKSLIGILKKEERKTIFVFMNFPKKTRPKPG